MEPLFAWETDPSRRAPGERVRSRVEYERWLVHARIEEGQRRVAAELARVQAAKHAPAPPRTAPPRAAPRPDRRLVPWHQVAGAVLVLAVLAAGALGRVRQLAQEPSVRPAHGSEAASHEGAPVTMGKPDAGTVGMGDDALAAASTERSSGDPTTRPGLRVDMLKKPLPGQKLPPCDPRWEVQLNGGCWYLLPTVKPPCGNGEYEWQGACYFPVRATARPTTSEPP